MRRAGRIDAVGVLALAWRRRGASALRIFIASLGTETNTFSPIPTGWAGFEESLFHRRDASRVATYYFAHPMRVWREEAEAGGHEVIESLAAFAQPAGPTSAPVWASLREMLLGDLAQAGPVDLILLHLHGAMVAEGCDDCEGELLRLIRAQAPKAVIAVELDLHCHLTDAMTGAADLIVLYKEYPHTDVAERARDLYRHAQDACAGRTRPVMRVKDCRMLGVWRTPLEPTRALVDRMIAREGRDGIISVSFSHGFPWADVPDVGAKTLVIADGDAAKAEAVAAEVAAEIWALRDETTNTLMSLAEAVDLALDPPPGLTVLADVSDNAGAGAGSDSTFLLAALLARGATRTLLGCIWDPLSVRFCHDAGEGARLRLRLAGKTGPMSGDPIDAEARVLRVLRDARQTFAGGLQPMGDAALIEIGGVHVAINAVRAQTFHPNAFIQFGVDLGAYRAVFVKSAQHFHAGFAPVADRIHFVAAPGVASPDFRGLKLPRAGRPLWPQVADPFAGG